MLIYVISGISRALGGRISEMTVPQLPKCPLGLRSRDILNYSYSKANQNIALLFWRVDKFAPTLCVNFSSAFHRAALKYLGNSLGYLYEVLPYYIGVQVHLLAFAHCAHGASAECFAER
jgi:hypothetical protein